MASYEDLSINGHSTMVTRIFTKIKAWAEATFATKAEVGCPFPVGSIYISISSTNPSNIWTGTTWEAWGSGRVPVGVDTSDSNFKTVEKTGGSSTINLQHSHTVNEHSHTLSHTHTMAHKHDISSGYALVGRSTSTGTMAYKNAGTISGKYDRKLGGSLGISGVSETITDTTALYGDTGGSSATKTGGASNTTTSKSAPETNNKLSTSQSILQPYITCYMWKRTA